MSCPSLHSSLYLKGLKPLFTREQLDPVNPRLDERCRTLEF
jgi:hypothetical protein